MKVNTEMAQQFNKLYDSGLKLKYIANKYKLSAMTISRYIWKPRPKGKIPIIDKEIGQQIDLLKAELWTTKDIVGILKISQGTINKYLRG